MTCETCPFFSHLQNQCRRNPPTGVPIPTREGITMMGTWPPTQKSEWCGEHPKRKEDLTLKGILPC